MGALASVAVVAGADSRSTAIASLPAAIITPSLEAPSTPPEVSSTPPKVLSTPLEMVPPTSARLAKGAEGHIRLIAKRETIKSWREIVTAKHETTVSWHETKINMMKSKIEDS